MNPAGLWMQMTDMMRVLKNWQLHLIAARYVPPPYVNPDLDDLDAEFERTQRMLNQLDEDGEDGELDTLRELCEFVAR